MSLTKTPELQTFLSAYFPDTDPESDDETTRAFVSTTTPERLRLISTQAKRLLESPEFPTEEFGTEANRWFADADEGRAWLSRILGILEGGSAAEATVVKDSNGTVLTEGDSVQVIKDLKVKGGSSDLKRGTLIKKIHLIDDPENIECRVDGSTLVLKTCFLKKA